MCEMRASPAPRRTSTFRSRVLLGAALVAVILSCGREVTGPAPAAQHALPGFSWIPVFPPAFDLAGGTGVVAFTRVHVVLHRTSGAVALDTVINFPSGADSLTLSLTVRLLENAPVSGEPMSLNLGYINAAGDTVFRGGPVSVTASPPPPGGGTNPPVQVPLSYTGPGANATSVVVAPRSTTVFAGGVFSFTATARDANGATLATTPIIWNSLDPAIATITSAAAGAGVAGNARGTARIVAQLFSGPSDTVRVNVLLPASQIIRQAGNAQTGIVGTALAQALVAKVAASDGVGVAGTTVNFAVATGGGSLTSASAVSDSAGLAQTTWKLGSLVGAQTVTATAGTLTNSPLTFTATATAGAATKLVVTTQPVNGTAGIALAPVVFTAQDAAGNVATAFTGPVTVTLGGGPAGATLSGATTVNAVAGVATFSTLAINRNATGYTLTASSTGLTGATTGAFDIVAGAPNKLVFTVQPSAAVANITITPAIVVSAQDSLGNPTPAFTGAITLALAVNPTGATLGGTIIQSAVNGVATFNDISVSLQGSAYVLSASATGLAAGASAPFDIVVGPPASFTLVSGGGQSGGPGATLPMPIVVKVADANGNGIAGASVTFTPNFGSSGSVSPSSGVTDASGTVSTMWTLGGGIGQAIIATNSALPADTLTIPATCTPGCGEFAASATGTRGRLGALDSPARLPSGDAIRRARSLLHLR